MTHASARLHARRKAGLSLTEALGAAAGCLTAPGVQAVGLLYGRDACLLVEIDANGMARDRSGEVRTDGVYEARCFSSSAELRWLQDGPHGRAAVLSTDEHRLGSLHWTEESSIDVTSDPPLKTTYLLWGRGTDDRNGRWSRLFAPRIGSLWVPTHVEKGGRAAIVAHEYVVTDAHGNATVGEELLVSLGVAAR